MPALGLIKDVVVCKETCFVVALGKLLAMDTALEPEALSTTGQVDCNVVEPPDTPASAACCGSAVAGTAIPDPAAMIGNAAPPCEIFRLPHVVSTLDLSTRPCFLGSCPVNAAGGPRFDSLSGCEAGRRLTGIA